MIRDVLTAFFVLFGSTVALTAAIGIVRFPDTLSRMHAATKPQTFGMILVLIGALIQLDGHVDSGMLVLTGLFTLITAPVIAQRVGRLVYREQRIDEHLLDESQLRARDQGH
ncbi:monovalent cation/H(+) antiporter subunit G [Gordonia sp. HY002]|uniref:monovalent cation/H(+) antiporter subunit G n=1 Tax=Gordonia zhenghanii TaxID=2911516 RepID=UPI001EF01FE3|nr:monovalent cation/H(+) antiporter subunit G [Gordonia zhenghanii]MCF8569095.1 monovalent cation/H(+) antiporter subunit G [Gordonia zhenghanii]MCF8603414.1 monovalent cation/H(+) antiporter subunit G [Gordonia zhenghanii]